MTPRRNRYNRTSARPSGACARAARAALIGAALITGATSAGCSSTPKPRAIHDAAIPVRDTTPRERKAEPAREEPPASGPPRAFRFPTPVWSELPNGLKIATVQNRALPVVQIRVAVLGGSSTDGEKPGLASLTAQILKESGAGGMPNRELLARVESLGATLSIDTDQDRTSLGLAVTKDHLGEALDLLGAIVARPQIGQAEFERLKKRAIERAAASAKEDGEWGASMILWRDLFALPADRHPYASYDAAPEDLAKITAADCRAYHGRSFVPKNTFVVIAGDATPEEAKRAVEKAFGGLRGGEPPVVSFTDPMPPEGRKITLVDRPKSSQSSIYAGMLGPRPSDAGWPSFEVATGVLGRAFTGRLSLDLREARGLAYITYAQTFELANSPSVFVAYAATQTPKTGLALKALLDHLERIGTTAPEEREVETAANNAAGYIAIGMDRPGALADEVVYLRALGLPDDHPSTFAKAARDVTPALVSKIASEHVRPGHEVVVVAGDSQVIGPMLSHFGEVKVVDPTKGFERIRTIPMNAGAPLEAPGEPGK